VILVMIFSTAETKFVSSFTSASLGRAEATIMVGFAAGILHFCLYCVSMYTFILRLLLVVEFAFADNFVFHSLFLMTKFLTCRCSKVSAPFSG